MIKLKIRIWIVGRVTDELALAWEFIGAFLTKRRAKAACRGRGYFIGPAYLGETAPDETQVWPGAFYPLGRADSQLHREMLKEYPDLAAPVPETKKGFDLHRPADHVAKAMIQKHTKRKTP
ncbi:MAG: hypothetical protein WC322_04910 [Candidatus Paceibacterota bacterium]|jgi:hypothetical protein